jgi:hypothetical protein
VSNVHLHIDNFNSGELSPLLSARMQVEKRQNGCAQLRNFIPHVHGPAFRRPGMQFMGPAVGGSIKSCLRGFNFSTSTGFILEFHPSGLRVWDSDGAVELENAVELPYSETECFELQLAQVNDVVYIAHPEHMPRRLVRYPDSSSGAAVWKLEDITWDWPALGDENVRIDEIATPATTELLSRVTEQWPEFEVPAGTIDMSIVNPDLTAPEKIIRLQRRDLADTTWVNVLTFSWTTVAPDPQDVTVGNANTWRVISVGGQGGPSGSEALVEWTGDDYSLNLEVIQPVSLDSVVVPSGEWQVLIDSNTTKPAGVTVSVQKYTGGAWTTIKTLTPIAGQIVTWRGPTVTVDPTQIRLKWNGRAMDGEMSIERLVFPTSTNITLAIDVVSGEDRTLTASEPIFEEGHINSFWQLTHRRESSFVSISKTGGAAPGTAFVASESAEMRVQGNWEVFTYGIWTATVYLEKFANGDWETLRSWEGKDDRNVIANGTEENEVRLRLRVSTGTATSSEGFADVRFTLEAADARVSGIVQLTDIGTPDANGKATTATVDVLTTIHATTATSLWTEGAWSGVNGYPRSVALHGQRLWFGGTRKEPLRLWGSVVNDFQNFRQSTFDDAAVSFTPSAQQSNQLQWMASFGEDLVLGTLGDEWTLSGGTERGPITPTGVLMQRRSGYGSNYLPGVLMGDVVTFVQRGGKKVRQVSPRADGIVWSAADLTVLAEHVTRKGIVQMVSMTFPFSILWAVTTDGKLLGMTHETEQNVFAWHVHETDGLVESVAVVLGTESDQVWLSVLRNGQRNIERLDPNVFGQRWDELSTLCFSDGAVIFEPEEETNVVTGLAHLEGKEVIVLGDGAELTPRTVNGGQITLEENVSVAVVGLPFTSTLQPMRREVPLQSGTSQHCNWKTARIGLHLYETLACQIADAPDMRFDTIQFRNASTPMDSAPPLYTGDKEAAVDARTRDGIEATVKTAGPLPLNVIGLTWEGDISGAE